VSVGAEASGVGYVAPRLLQAQPAPPARRQVWSGTRLTGTTLLGFWIALALGLALYVWLHWNPDLIARYGLELLAGLGVTLQLVAGAIVLGAALAMPVAFARLSRNPILNGIAFAYVYFFRGTPLLAQVFLIYYGAGQFRGALEAVGLWSFLREAYTCALITFALNTAAYQAEIYRGAIAAVPRGQWEAAEALGLRRRFTFLHVAAPQALITALRPLGNEIVFMIKGSAVASVITVYDLMGETRLAFSRTFDFQVYLWAALLYLAIVEALRRVWDAIEARLTRHLRRDRIEKPGPQAAAAV
jgi:polar amino acid transport system permease protein